ncbi:MAG: LysR substrate-binding domain-containing protein [Pseudomonadota bacterium]
MALLPITLRQLEYLCELADTLNFNEAAQRCHVSQPTISSAIQALEQQLNVALFERDKRRVTLTVEGEAVVEHAREAVQRARDVVQFTRDCADVSAGELTVGAIPTIAPFCFATMLQRSRTRFPQLQVALREQQTQSLIDALDRGDVDIGLLALPADVAHLQCRIVGGDPLRLVASDSHRACTTSGTSLNEFGVEELVWLEEGHCLRDQGIAACGIQADIPEQLTVNSLLTMVQLVASGYGAALVPQLALDANILSGLPVSLVDTVEQPSRELAWVCRASHPKAAFLLGEFADAMSTAVLRDAHT